MARTCGWRVRRQQLLALAGIRTGLEARGRHRRIRHLRVGFPTNVPSLRFVAAYDHFGPLPAGFGICVGYGRPVRGTVLGLCLAVCRGHWVAFRLGFVNVTHVPATGQL